MQQRTPTPTRLRPGSKSGFSLAELMVVIVIIGLLATMVAPQLMQRFGKAQRAVTISTLKTIDDALQEYWMDNSGKWPDGLEVLVQEDDKGTKYLDRTTVPQDAWDNDLVYEINADGKAEVWSLGADGEQGGEGKDEDFSNITIKDL